MTPSNNPSGGTKKCCRCGERKPLERFGNNKRSSDGKLGHCKDCTASEMRKWRRSNPNKVRANNRKHRYGITAEEFALRLSEQMGLCLVCSDPIDEATACVDHCHTHGHVRGLLCHPCNKGLGHFRDDTERLAKALAYLER